MINQWLNRLNLFLIILAIITFGAAGYYRLQRPDEIESKHLQSGLAGLPKTAFEFPEEVYEGIGKGILALQEAPPALQAPDLRSQLVYYGKNGRPDAQKKETLLHLALTSQSKEVTSIKPGSALYLIFDRTTSPGRYLFSPNNEKTSLSVIATPYENDAEIRVVFENEKGEAVNEPAQHIVFRLPEKEFSRISGTAWEIGSFRVDATLFARQKARWYGFDRFLEHHGGDEYLHAIGKQRIDFGENDDVYSVFVQTGDLLVWDRNQWRSVEPGANSLGHPLLVVKKVDERLMSFELWDVEGKGKVLLNLLKTTEPWTLQNPQALAAMFKFVGARTRSQCVFEINRERMILSPSDWLLLTSKGWKKLCSAEEIEHYVNRKKTGTLFIFEGLVRKDERQLMLGKLYSPARQEYQEIELALQPGSKTRPEKEIKETKETKDRELKEAKEVADLIGEILAPLTKHDGKEIGASSHSKNFSSNATLSPLGKDKDKEQAKH